MRLTWLSKEAVFRDWGRIGALLYLATRHDPSSKLRVVLDRVLAGTTLILEASDGAHGYLVIGLDDSEGELIAETVAIVGKFDGGPKRRLNAVRLGMDAVEDALRHANVKRHRIFGRNYSKLFPDYMPVKGTRNGLEKVL